MILELISIVLLAILIDLLFGDPKNKFHPTVWVGLLVGKMVKFAQKYSSNNEKLAGIFVTISITSLVAAVMYFSNLALNLQYISNLKTEQIGLFVLSIMISAVLLKTTFAIKGMEQHARQVIDAVFKNELDEARKKLSMIVKRDTKNLDKQHIVSSTLESISENTVDGITGPLFYFAIFGLPGAFVYRTINTIDSMIGYKTPQFRNLGWFGANCDKVLNYLPSRLTSFVMILAVMILRADWKHSLKIMIQDNSKTESPNAGYPMAALAGALGVKFEKIGHYTLGDGAMEFTAHHFQTSISIMKLTALLFCIIFTLPLLILFSYLGWFLYA